MSLSKLSIDNTCVHCQNNRELPPHRLHLDCRKCVDLQSKMMVARLSHTGGNEENSHFTVIKMKKWLLAMLGCAVGAYNIFITVGD
jgi:hypothetical protein